MGGATASNFPAEANTLPNVNTSKGLLRVSGPSPPTRVALCTFRSTHLLLAVRVTCARMLRGDCGRVREDAESWGCRAIARSF
jgi:hypothetical protein